MSFHDDSPVPIWNKLRGWSVVVAKVSTFFLVLIPYFAILLELHRPYLWNLTGDGIPKALVSLPSWLLVFLASTAIAGAISVALQAYVKRNYIAVLYVL